MPCGTMQAELSVKSALLPWHESLQSLRFPNPVVNPHSLLVLHAAPNSTTINRRIELWSFMLNNGGIKV